MDESKNQQWAEQFVRILGLHIEEQAVRIVVETLRGKTNRTGYDLWKPGWYRDGRQRQPVCGKGTVAKIKSLYNEGKLGDYVEFLDRLPQATP